MNTFPPWTVRNWIFRRPLILLFSSGQLTKFQNAPTKLPLSFLQARQYTCSQTSRTINWVDVRIVFYTAIIRNWIGGNRVDNVSRNTMRHRRELKLADFLLSNRKTLGKLIVWRGVGQIILWMLASIPEKTPSVRCRMVSHCSPTLQWAIRTKRIKGLLEVYRSCPNRILSDHR